MEWPRIPRPFTSGVSFVFAVGGCGHTPNAGNERNDEPAQFRFPDHWPAWRLGHNLVPGASKLNLDCGKIETAGGIPGVYQRGRRTIGTSVGDDPA